MSSGCIILYRLKILHTYYSTIFPLPSVSHWSQDAIRKREERAKRFGIKEEQSHPPPSSDHEVELDVAKLEARSKRFGTELLLANGQPVKFVGSLPPVPAGRLRHRAVHLHGLDEMSTEDVFQFFSLYGPRNIEWLNDQSCENHIISACDRHVTMNKIM